MVNPATWDDLGMGNWDQLYTWDDPARNIALDAAYARGEIVIDAMNTTVDWEGDRPNDQISPSLARSEFLGTAASGLAATTIGGYAWTINTAAAFAEGSGFGYLRPISVNVAYSALIDAVSEVDFDVLACVRATSLFTGARGAFALYARYQSSSNFLRIRLDFNTDQVMGYGLERNVNGVLTTVSSGLFPNLYHDPTAWIWFRVQGSGANLRLKAWQAGKEMPREWNAYLTDSVFQTTAGRSGWGGYLAAGNSNSLPYTEFQVETYWQGANASVDSAMNSVGLSLDDGFPSAVTTTSNIGVNEASADLLGSLTTSPDTYYSTFRSDQPFSDLPRDTAGVAITGQVVAQDGIRAIRLFTGQMTDIPLDDQSAKLLAVSATRLALSTPIQPPAVHGFYEGAEATWLIGYALFKSGVYVAPKPLDGCRLYVPMNGSTHAYIPDNNYGAAGLSGVRFLSLNKYRYERPDWIDGPFSAAPDFRLDADGVRKMQIGPGNMWMAPGSGMLTQSEYRGRIEFWVKGDATNAAGSMNPGQGDLVQIRIGNVGPSRYGSIIIAGDRTVRLQLSDGVLARTYYAAPLPADGRWHFIGASWEIGPSSPSTRITLDDMQIIYNSSLLNANLPATDDLTEPDFQSCLPIVEIQISAGPTAVKAAWSKDRPSEPGAILRRSILDFESIAEKAPREAFEVLSSLAQAELAHTGFDDQDRYCYLPMSYWGEMDQQLVVETLSTDTNLGQKFRPYKDVKRIYNQISLSYKRSSVQETWVQIYQTSELVTIGPQVTLDLICPLNDPIVETRTLAMSIASGTALAGSPPTETNPYNYITLNLATDGSGFYASSTEVDVAITSWNPGAITVRIRNKTGFTWFLANNVSIPPLGLAAKRVLSSDATESYQVDPSIMERGIRSLPVNLPTIQTAQDAGTIARCLAGFLAYPRATFQADAFPDMRRQPGQLVHVSDADGTGLDGQFRLTGISTAQDGAALQQVVAADEAWPIFTWGESRWGQAIWGEG